jgi:hypothetical protein
MSDVDGTSILSYVGYERTIGNRRFKNDQYAFDVKVHLLPRRTPSKLLVAALHPQGLTARLGARK